MLTLLLSLLLLIYPYTIYAISDPLGVPNNIYGMHIADFNDIADVAPLVNSSGGDWGYITLVSTDHDRNMSRWQNLFDQMRRTHLIPLVRIATHVEKDYWVKPSSVDFDGIVSFFNSLNWPTENRYIIIYNEPNHAKEWGNMIDPEGYAKSLTELSQKFKAASQDFFILPAGLDVSAGSDGLSLNAAEYLKRMITAEPTVLQSIDGWTSHSYPNPGFSGSPFAAGRGTLRSFDWELSNLQSLGLNKKLPVFITETGWVRGDLTSEQIGINLLQAAIGAWADQRVVAVTPFVFNYQDVPFATFSWKRLSGQGGYYPQYENYKTIKKIKGEPRQKEIYALLDPILPPVLVAGGTYTLKAQIENKGQGILSSGYEIVFETIVDAFTMLAESLPTLEPSEKGNIEIHLKAPQTSGNYDAMIGIKRFGEITILQTQSILVVPPPSLSIGASLGWRRTSEANDVTVLVYDEGKLVHKFSGLSINDGVVGVEGLANILPGRQYRIVLLVPYYLPRQAILALNATETKIAMKRLLPLDFNLDGKLDMKDLLTAFSTKPKNILKLFVGP